MHSMTSVYLGEDDLKQILSKVLGVDIWEVHIEISESDFQYGDHSLSIRVDDVSEEKVKELIGEKD